MQNLNYGTGSQTIAVYPEVSSSYFNNPSGSFRLELSQDWDRSTTTVPATLLNTPTRVTPRLVLSINQTNLPEYSGLYTIQVKEGLTRRYKWGNTHVKWTDANWTWSAQDQFTDSRVLDNDRAYVSGSDIPSFLQYTTSSTEYIYQSGSGDDPITQYTSSNEYGAYSTYHG
jgi:hypothetical protein